MSTVELRAEELRPEHLGRQITVPVGLETATLFLSRLSFSRYEKSLRIAVEDGRGAYYNLPAYGKVSLA